MKDYSAIFKNPLQYPNYDNVKTRIEKNVLKQLSENKISVGSLDELNELVTIKTNTACNFLRDNYRDNEERLKNNFKKMALNDSGFEQAPKEVRDIVFDKAWNDAHSYGYNEVYARLEEMYDLINSILQALNITW